MKNNYKAKKIVFILMLVFILYYITFNLKQNRNVINNIFHVQKNHDKEYKTDFIPILGKWLLQKVVLESEVVKFSTTNEFKDYNLEKYEGLELELLEDKICFNGIEWKELIYKNRKNIKVSEYNRGGKFKLPDFYGFIDEEKILLSNNTGEEYMGDIELINYEILLTNDNFPISTNIILLNSDNILIGNWGKVIWAKKIKE